MLQNSLAPWIVRNSVTPFFSPLQKKVIIFPRSFKRYFTLHLTRSANFDICGPQDAPNQGKIIPKGISAYNYITFKRARTRGGGGVLGSSNTPDSPPPPSPTHTHTPRSATLFSGWRGIMALHAILKHTR